MRNLNSYPSLTTNINIYNFKTLDEDTQEAVFKGLELLSKRNKRDILNWFLSFFSQRTLADQKNFDLLVRSGRHAYVVAEGICLLDSVSLKGAFGFIKSLFVGSSLNDFSFIINKLVSSKNEAKSFAELICTAEKNIPFHYLETIADLKNVDKYYNELKYAFEYYGKYKKNLKKPLFINSYVDLFIDGLPKMFDTLARKGQLNNYYIEWVIRVFTPKKTWGTPLCDSSQFHHLINLFKLKNILASSSTHLDDLYEAMSWSGGRAISDVHDFLTRGLGMLHQRELVNEGLLEVLSSTVKQIDPSFARAFLVHVSKLCASDASNYENIQQFCEYAISKSKRILLKKGHKDKDIIYNYKLKGKVSEITQLTQSSVPVSDEQQQSLHDDTPLRFVAAAITQPAGSATQPAGSATQISRS